MNAMRESQSFTGESRRPTIAMPSAWMGASTLIGVPLSIADSMAGMADGFFKVRQQLFKKCHADGFQLLLDTRPCRL